MQTQIPLALRIMALLVNLIMIEFQGRRCGRYCRPGPARALRLVRITTLVRVLATKAKARRKGLSWPGTSGAAFLTPRADRARE
jgi:hypothetical protein